MNIDFFNIKDREIDQLIKKINSFELVGERLSLVLDRFFENLNKNERNYYISILKNKKITVLDDLIDLMNQIRNIYDNLNTEQYEYEFGFVKIDPRLMLFIDLCLQRCFNSVTDNTAFREVSYTYFSDWPDDVLFEQKVGPFDEDCEYFKDFLSDLETGNAIQSFLLNNESLQENSCGKNFIQNLISALKDVDTDLFEALLRSLDEKWFFYFENNVYQDGRENRYILAKTLYNELIGKYISKVCVEDREEVAILNSGDSTDDLILDDLIKPVAKHIFYKNIEINDLINTSKKDVIICFKMMNHYGYFLRKLSLAEIAGIIRKTLGLEVSLGQMKKYGHKNYRDWLEKYNDIPIFLNS